MKFDIDSFGEIVASLTRNKSRTLLTGFGVFWGLFMLLFLIGGGAGIKTMLADNFAGFATNTTVLWSSTTSLPYKGMKEGRYWYMTYKDIDRLKMMVPQLDVVTPNISQWGVTAVNDAQSTDCIISGVAADYCKIEEPRLKYGRWLNDVDIKQNRKVCVIGKNIYKNLFPEGGDPCGQYILVGSIYYQVVGVNFASGNLNINGSATNKVSIPVTIAQQVYNRGESVDLICMTGKGGIQMSTLEKRLRQIMSREHLFDPEDEPALMIMHTEQIFKIVDNLFRSWDFLIWLVGLGTLLAGAIGVSNIMMVTVRERTVEIGIRRAIGATPWDILSQIILESIFLTLVAGLAGIMFSVGALSLVEMIAQHQAAFQISFGTAISAALLLTVLGVLAGLAPAYRAMNIKPVDAMRDE